MIRRATATDMPAIARVHSTAFGDEGRLIVELVAALAEHRCSRDDLSFVVDEGGDVVAHAMVTASRLDTFRRTIDVAVVSPVGVHPDHHGRGIGTALVSHCTAAADDHGFPVVFVEGDPVFYSRRGFVPGRPLGFRKPSIRVPDDAFQVILLSAYEPWMTGTLVYAEPFWDLDCVGLREPDFLAWLTGEVAQGRQL